MPLDNALPSALKSSTLVMGTGAFCASTRCVIEEPSFRLVQGVECLHLPLQRVLKLKCPQCYSCRYHHLPFHPYSRLER